MEGDNKNLLKAYNMLLYFAGSMLMNEPTKECILDFWAGGSLKNLPVRSNNPRFISASSQLRTYEKSRDKLRDDLVNNHRLLFNGNNDALAPPNEAHYHTPHEMVTNFYSAYGWNFRIKTGLDDDHVGTELLFLTKLIDKYIQLDDEPCIRVMKTEIRRFIDQHLLSWIPAWNFNVQENASTTVYKGVGNLIHASLEDIYNILKEPVRIA
jgi:TorA maturation chaperone TorD